jgi:hypothetical protein
VRARANLLVQVNDKVELRHGHPFMGMYYAFGKAFLLCEVKLF